MHCGINSLEWILGWAVGQNGGCGTDVLLGHDLNLVCAAARWSVHAAAVQGLKYQTAGQACLQERCRLLSMRQSGQARHAVTATVAVQAPKHVTVRQGVFAVAVQDPKHTRAGQGSSSRGSKACKSRAGNTGGVQDPEHATISLSKPCTDYNAYRVVSSDAGPHSMWPNNTHNARGGHTRATLSIPDFKVGFFSKQACNPLSVFVSA